MIPVKAMSSVSPSGFPASILRTSLADGGRLKQPGRFQPGGRQRVPDIILARMSEKSSR